MKRALAISTFAVSSLFADTIERSNNLDNRDVQAIREWINTKRQVTVKELGGALSLAGEVRAEFQKVGETKSGIRQRGEGGATPINSSAFDVEVNIMLDYRADRTWGTIKLEFDNDQGIMSGSFNRIKLEKAYFGGRLLDQDTYTGDVEVGRRKLGNILDSKLEFTAFFDGVWFKYDHTFEKVGDFYIHAGPFLVNERVNQYAYVGEFGVFDIGDTGLYTKYSFIDWDTKHFDTYPNNKRFDYMISQLILGYKFMPQPLDRAVVVYSGGLWNHAADKLAITDFTRANYGGYIGFTIGELKKRGDWSFDANYQVLAAQAVPDFDVSGIGLGNASNSGFYTTNIEGTGALTTRATAAGNGNYRGFMLTLDYLLTGTLMLEQQWMQSITLDDNIGPFRRYKQYEIEFIYAF
jgi:hypothetical protein